MRSSTASRRGQRADFFQLADGVTRGGEGWRYQQPRSWISALTRCKDRAWLGPRKHAARGAPCKLSITFCFQPARTRAAPLRPVELRRDDSIGRELPPVIYRDSPGSRLSSRNSVGNDAYVLVSYPRRRGYAWSIASIRVPFPNSSPLSEHRRSMKPRADWWRAPFRDRNSRGTKGPY